MMLDEDDSEGLREFCANLHPATVAEALEELETDQVWKVIGHAAIRDQANVFEYFPLERQV